jgi:hypothetical protein
VKQIESGGENYEQFEVVPYSKSFEQTKPNFGIGKSVFLPRAIVVNDHRAARFVEHPP